MAAGESPIVKTNETTPLISREQPEPRKFGKSVLYRALFCGFLVSLSFGVTQVPLLYVIRLMTCEAYYDTHPDNSAPGSDRCSNRFIEAETSRAIALVSFSTSTFGVINLFITGWTIKKLGIKSALLISVFWPAIRLAVQNVGVEVGGNAGIIIVQCSQIITVIGGPVGYILALNSYVTEITESEERTGTLGRLQGCTFFGNSIAYMAGGLISDHFGIIAPFRVTVALFFTSFVYTILLLPGLPPIEEPVTQKTGLSNFFGPLKLFIPQKWVLKTGKVQREYGTMFLGIGAFLGVLATGYQSVLLQMYGTDRFGFGPTENGYLISLNTFVRGLFLTMVFPRIISIGRVWMAEKDRKKDALKGSDVPDLPQEASEYAAIEPLDQEEQPIEPSKQRDKEQTTFAFDLSYVRYSLLADAILTGAATFITQGWEMYLIAFILPLAAGTGSSAKGSILQMCQASERADALSAITLVEMMARLVTTTVFGLIFAALAEADKTYLVFLCNGAAAFVGFVVLLFTHFPPNGSHRFEEASTVESQSSSST